VNKQKGHIKERARLQGITCKRLATVNFWYGEQKQFELKCEMAKKRDKRHFFLGDFKGVNALEFECAAKNSFEGGRRSSCKGGIPTYNAMSSLGPWGKGALVNQETGTMGYPPGQDKTTCAI